MHDYHNLVVWKKAKDFVKPVYEITKSFPHDELYVLTSQLRRAVVSVVANIVEGRGKNSDKDFLRFLYIANGSLDECHCYIELAVQLNYITKSEFDQVDIKRREVGYLLSKLIKTIQSPKAS